MIAIKSSFKLLGLAFVLAMAVWLANAIAVFGMRANILEIYSGSGRTAIMANSAWAFVPIGVISTLIAAGTFILVADEAAKKKYRAFFCFVSSAIVILGAIFLVSWFLQLVVDIRKI